MKQTKKPESLSEYLELSLDEKISIWKQEKKEKEQADRAKKRKKS